MAFYRGQDGSLTVGGSAMLQLESWSLTTTLEELDTTSMGDPWKSVVGGQASWSGQASAKIDLVAASVQNTTVAQLIAATPAGTTAALVFRANGTTKTFSGNALLKNIQVQEQLGQIVKITFDFTGSGALAFAWT